MIPKDFKDPFYSMNNLKSNNDLYSVVKSFMEEKNQEVSIDVIFRDKDGKERVKTKGKIIDIKDYRRQNNTGDLHQL